MLSKLMENLPGKYFFFIFFDYLNIFKFTIVDIYAFCILLLSSLLASIMVNLSLEHSLEILVCCFVYTEINLLSRDLV